MTRGGYNPVNVGQAIELDPNRTRPRRRLTDEQQVEVDKAYRKQATSQLVVAFTQAALHGVDVSTLTKAAAKKLVANVYTMADTVFEITEERDKKNPINRELLEGIS